MAQSLSDPRPCVAVAARRALVLSLALALVACSRVDVVQLDRGVTVLVAPQSDSGDSALLRGTLAVLDGCLGIDDTVVIWPHGTELVEGEAIRIDVPHLGTFAVGDDVSVGGGMAVEPPARRAVEVAGVAVPAGCADHTIWMSAP